MKNRIYTLVIIFLIFTSYSCKSQANDNYVKFNIDSPPNMRPTENKFKNGEYQLALKSIYVMEGSNTGMKIEFQKKEDDKNTLSLFFLLPSGDSFKVFTKNSGFEYKVPTSISNEDFKDIFSARAHQRVYAYIYIQRNIRLASDHSSVESVYFEIFSIAIKEFKIEGEKISFSGEFTGSLSENQLKVQDVDYKITGEFQIKDFGIGVMMVDD